MPKLVNCKTCGGPVAYKAKTCPHCGAVGPGIAARGRRNAIAVVLLLAAIGIWAWLAHRSPDPDILPRRRVADPPVPAGRKAADILPHVIVEMQYSSLLGRQHGWCEVLIEEEMPPLDEAIHELARALLREKGQHCDEFHICFNLEGMGKDLYYAVAVFGNEHLPEFRVSTMVKEAMAKPYVAYGGFDEATSRQIFWELVAAEDRAHRETDAKYPPADLNEQTRQQSFDYCDTLREQYEAAVRQRYALTKEVATDISLQGATRNWPTPEP